MALFTLTINNFATALDKQHQEVQRIHCYLNLAAQDVRGAAGKHTSGNILDPGGVTVVGSWTYTPQAAS
jgi:hypothetical protein